MARPLTGLQLRALQAYWGEKMRRAGIRDLAISQEMRYEYITAATEGRARSTKELSQEDARAVINALAAELRPKPITDAAAARDAATHGRRGDVSHPRMAGENEFSMRESYRRTLGWSREAMEAFVHRQLRGREVRSLAQHNKVLWALKAIHRRRRAG